MVKAGLPACLLDFTGALLYIGNIFIHSGVGLPQDRTISEGRQLRLLPLNPQGGGGLHSTETSLTKWSNKVILITKNGQDLSKNFHFLSQTQSFVSCVLSWQYYSISGSILVLLFFSRKCFSPTGFYCLRRRRRREKHFTS